MALGAHPNSHHKLQISCRHWEISCQLVEVGGRNIIGSKELLAKVIKCHWLCVWTSHVNFVPCSYGNLRTWCYNSGCKSKKGKKLCDKGGEEIVYFSLSCVARSYHMEWLNKSSILGANHNTLQQKSSCLHWKVFG
jgi:hypothetical protein